MDNLLTVGIVLGGIYLYSTHKSSLSPSGDSIGSEPGVDELDLHRYRHKHRPHGNREIEMTPEERKARKEEWIAAHA